MGLEVELELVAMANTFSFKTGRGNRNGTRRAAAWLLCIPRTSRRNEGSMLGAFLGCVVLAESMPSHWVDLATREALGVPMPTLPPSSLYCVKLRQGPRGSD